MSGHCLATIGAWPTRSRIPFRLSPLGVPRWGPGTCDAWTGANTSDTFRRAGIALTVFIDGRARQARSTGLPLVIALRKFRRPGLQSVVKADHAAGARGSQALAHSRRRGLAKPAIGTLSLRFSPLIGRQGGSSNPVETQSPRRVSPQVFCEKPRPPARRQWPFAFPASQFLLSISTQPLSKPHTRYPSCPESPAQRTTGPNDLEGDATGYSHLQKSLMQAQEVSHRKSHMA